MRLGQQMIGLWGIGKLLQVAVTLAMTTTVALCGAQAASASPQTLASVTVRSPIGAYGGWVVWSAPVNGDWGLDAYHAGEVKALHVAPRAQPFDVDLGTNASGEVVATFSRCVKTPRYEADLFLELEGVGCRVHVLNLASELEKTPAIPHPADTSDTTPSMWDGNIAFARYDPRHHADVAQLLLWSGRTHKLRVLRHGATPTGQPCPLAKGEVGRRIGESKTECLPNSIKGDITDGAIESIDLGPDLVSFLWKIDGPGVISTGGGWEVRADRLTTGASILTGSGFHGDVCMAGIDGSVPSYPSVEGERVWYTQLESECYVNTISVERFDTATGRLSSSTPVEGEVLQVIHSGSALYALVAPIPRGQPPTCTTTEPCMIERLPIPKLKLEKWLPQSPFA
jgi:hypothetical protein